jgi:hypothetical protein
MRIVLAAIGIALVGMTASGCVIGGDEPWDDNPAGDSDTDTGTAGDGDADSDTDTGSDSDSDGDNYADITDADELFTIDGGVDAGTDGGTKAP